MIKEMLLQLPNTREALLGITGFTEAIFENYKGQEFLRILQNYSNAKNKTQSSGLSIDVNKSNTESKRKSSISRESPQKKDKNEVKKEKTL